MRKTLQLCTLLLAALCMIGCGGDNGVDNKPNTPENPENPENPNDPEQPAVTPEISITEVELTFDSYTFEVTTNVEGELGYVYVKEGFDVPQFQDWFAHHSEQIKDKVTIKISDLNDATTYKLCVVLRSSKDGVLSAPKMVTFTTPDDGVENPITIDHVTYDTIIFTINIPGSYVFQCIDKAYLERVNQTPESYIETVGIGVQASGAQTIEWTDGGKIGDYDMNVRPDSDYYVIAAIANKQEVVGDIFVRSLHTPKPPQSTAGTTTELKDITSTSVTINTVPDSNVAEYYVYVRDKMWAEEIIAGYGESMLTRLIKMDGATWKLTASNENTWRGLKPATEYYCMVVVVDNLAAEALAMIPFTTTEPSMGAPKVDMSLTRPSEDNHKTLSLNLYSTDAASVRVAFNTKADISGLRNEGYDDDYILRNYGSDLNAEQVEYIRTTGLSLKIEDLFPELEYIALVSVKNVEQGETIKAATMSTAAKPIPTRVESELFTSLLGEWEVSYSLINVNMVEATISNYKVTIAQGADATTEKLYRDQNRLVILGWPFNVSAQGVHEPMPYVSPAELMSEDANYWGKYPSLAYRDYGPKVFLEIGAGNTVTMPTERGEYFYNWSSDGTFYFFGCDYDNKFTAPATFPVTVSTDGNTITIGAQHSGEEFGYGIYRPAVFRDNDPWAVATGDIVMKRVK